MHFDFGTINLFVLNGQSCIAIRDTIDLKIYISWVFFAPLNLLFHPLISPCMINLFMYNIIMTKKDNNRFPLP